MSHNVLALPNPNMPFYLTISYTAFGYKAALLYERDLALRPIAFRSKILDPDVFKP